ncbi:MAG TPA: dihydrofolate reductase family protein [Solirubrobacterales bacterium]|nr:dihydrofolate reductase family protein [Solirubrobacterales bacterium]
MRKLIYSGNTSLDGYIEDENGSLDFTEPDDEVHRFWNQWVREAGASLMGRRLYEAMEPYWTDMAANPSGEPTTDEFARAWVETPRYVVSRTLDSVPDGLTLIKGDLETEVRSLKEAPGGHIDVGGADLANSLAELDLIDELMMVITPAIVGTGKPNFGPAFVKTAWKLSGTETFSSGALLVRYERDRS